VSPPLDTSSPTTALPGAARVIDGDTIEIESTRIRLEGIDAPEAKQSCRIGRRDLPCGMLATFHLAERIAGRPVTCADTGTDRYGRTLAIRYQDGEDLNAMMVRDGYALAYSQYSDRYVAEEASAQEARRGIWETEFIRPDAWRRAAR